MGPTWGQQDPGGAHVGHVNLAILDNTPMGGRSASVHANDDSIDTYEGGYSLTVSTIRTRRTQCSQWITNVQMIYNTGIE